MLTSDGRGTPGGPTATLRTNQILVLALIMGLLLFSGVVVFLEVSGRAPVTPTAAGGGPPPTDLLLLVMAAVTVATAIASFVMRSVIVTGLRRRVEHGTLFDERGLQAQFQVLTVLRAALAEGPALFGTVIVLISGNWLGFAGTAFGLVMLLIVFPTRAAFDGFSRDVTGRMPGP